MRTVLLVEDDPIFAETVVDLLSLAADCDVVSCLRASEALDKVQSKSFDLIMLDWQLPDMSGLDLLKKIKSINPDCIVMMMTGISDASALEAALDAGAIDILRKPFAAPQLIERTKLALNSNR